jgi:cellulose synthase operon protein C
MPRFQLAGVFRFFFLILISLQISGCSSPEERAGSYYTSGMKLLEAGENQKADVEFRNALKLKKDLLPAWRGLAQTREASRDWEGLVPVLQTILDLDPKDEATRLKLARFYLVGGAVEQALKVADETGEPGANDAALLALKAIIHYRLNEGDTALGEAQAALKIDPENPDALIVLAADRLARNDVDGALKLVSGETPAQKKDLELQLFKIKLYTQLKDYPKLESLLRDLTELHPEEVVFRKQLVSLYMYEHRAQDAERELRAIASADPKNPQPGLDLVWFLYSVKGPAAAREELLALTNGGADIFPYQLAMAELDYNQGRTSESFTRLQSLGRSAQPADAAKAQLLLAQLQLLQKNADAAEKLIMEVLAKDARNVDALKLRASIRLDRGQLDGAVSDLREALNDQPRSLDIMLALASAYERSGAVELADRQMADALKVSRFDPTVGLNYAAFLRRHSGMDRAYDVLTELTARWPSNVQILSALAEIKLMRQDWIGAQEIAETIKRIGDDGGLGDQIIGTALSWDRQYDASVAAFQAAVAAAPTAAQPMVGFVGALVRGKRTDKAVAFLQAALQKDPNSAEAHVLLGDIELSKNQSEEAEKNFKAAVEGQPKAEIGYRALSDFYARQKKFDIALGVIRTGIKELPESDVLHLTLANTLELKGDYEAAISEYDYLLKQQPDSMLIANNLASLLADHRADTDSLARARSLAARLQNSDIAQFKDTLGWVYYRQGDFRAAVPLLEAAVAYLPDLALARYHLGMSYIGIGQPAKASEQLKQALARSPGADLEAKIRSGLKEIVTQ